MRGVVLKHRTTPDRQRVYTLNSLDEPIRRAILYADKVRLPMADDIQLTPTPTTMELEAAHLLSYGARLVETWSDTTDPFRDMEDFVTFLQYSEFAMAERSEPGVWSMDQEGLQLFLPTGTPTEGRGLQVALDRLLPVPRHDVPIPDILTFKHKRASELSAFHAAMDGLYLMITSSQDSARAYEVAREAVQTAVADMFKAMQESIATKVIASCKVALNVNKVMSAIQIGNISGALGPTITLATTVAEMPSLLKRLGPFAYVHQVIDDLL